MSSRAGRSDKAKEHVGGAVGGDDNGRGGGGGELAGNGGGGDSAGDVGLCCGDPSCLLSMIYTIL